MCFSLLIGCGSQKLSSDFKEEDVKKAAENVINLINNKDSEGLKEICNVKMKAALTDDVLKQVYEAIGEGGKFEKVEKMSIGGTTDKSSFLLPVRGISLLQEDRYPDSGAVAELQPSDEGYWCGEVLPGAK